MFEGFERIEKFDWLQRPYKHIPGYFIKYACFMQFALCLLSVSYQSIHNVVILVVNDRDNE